MAGGDDDLPEIPSEAYRIESEVARGGIGRVLRAYHRGMRRTVAIKELLPGSEAHTARFVREALITGRLEHPAIVPVYEAGRFPDGQLFYSMKLVSGRSLLDAIKDARSLSERLALVPHVVAVAEAIAYAHARGVVHRDLKPANVVLGAYGETAVVDWGLAKELASDDERPDEPRPTAAVTPTPGRRNLGETELGDVLGTPGYMPPEQAMGRPVDARADVYALGALLYHVLTGAPPNVPTPLLAFETTRHYARDTQRATELLKGIIPVDAREHGVPPDLAAVVHKALRPEPLDRYPSAQELAVDLKNFLTDKLVSARRYGAWSLARRFVRRHRAAVVIAAVSATFLAVLGVESVRRIVRARDDAQAAQIVAETERARSQRQRDELLLLQARAALAADPTAAVAWLKRLPDGAPGREDAHAVAVDARSRGVARHVFRDHGRSVEALALSPDGRWLASAAPDGLVVRDLAGGGRPLRLAASARALAFAPAGAPEIVSADGDGLLVRWSLPAGARREVGRHAGRVSAVVVAPDGTIYSSGDDRTVRGWGRGDPIVTLTGKVTNVAISPDGARLAALVEEQAPSVVDIASGRVTRAPLDARSGFAAFSPDGRRLAATSLVDLEVADLEAGKKVGSIRLDTAAGPLAFAGPHELIIGCADGSVRVVAAEAFTARALRGHDGGVGVVAVDRAGAVWASGGRNGEVRVWARAALTGQGAILAAPAGHVHLHPDGRAVIALHGGALRLVDPATGAGEDLAGGRRLVQSAASTPDGRLIASVDVDGEVRVWDVAQKTSRVVFTGADRLRAVSVSADGALFAFMSGKRPVVVRLPGGDVVCKLEAERGRGVALVAGEKIYFGDGHDVYEGRLDGCTRRRVGQHADIIHDVSADPARTRAVSLAADGLVGLYDVATGHAQMLRGHDDRTIFAEFSADGRTLATTSADATVRLWDAVTGEPLRVLRGHDIMSTFVAFAGPRRLVSVSYDATLRVWDLDAGRSDVLRGHDGVIGDLAVSRDGTLALTSGVDRTVRRWRLDAAAIPADPAGLRRWLDEATSARIDEGSRLASPALH